MSLSQKSTNLSAVKSRVEVDAEVVESVNAKSNILASCYMLDDTAAFLAADTFGNGPTLIFSSSPDATKTFKAFDATTAAAEAAYRDTTGIAYWDSLFNTKDIVDGNASDLVVMFWIKSDDIPPSAQEAAFSYGTTTLDSSYYMFLFQSTNAVLRLGNGGLTDALFVQADYLTTDKWHLITCHIFNTGMSIYVDDGSGGPAGSVVETLKSVNVPDNDDSRSFCLAANGSGATISFELGLSDRSVQLSTFMAIKATSGLTAALSDIIAGQYRIGPGHLSEALKSL